MSHRRITSTSELQDAQRDRVKIEQSFSASHEGRRHLIKWGLVTTGAVLAPLGWASGEGWEWQARGGAATGLATVSRTNRGITEVELFRSDRAGVSATELLKTVERNAMALSSQPGFLSAGVHSSRSIMPPGAVVAWLQWTDEASRVAARAITKSERKTEGYEIKTYEVAYVATRDGTGVIRIETGRPFRTLIDVLETVPEKQSETLKFNIANSSAFTKEPGFQSTSVLRGLDGTRNATYSQWDRVTDWLNAVKHVAGEKMPAVLKIQTVEEFNANFGTLYHDSEVASVIIRPAR